MCQTHPQVIYAEVSKRSIEKENGHQQCNFNKLKGRPCKFRKSKI